MLCRTVSFCYVWNSHTASNTVLRYKFNFSMHFNLVYECIRFHIAARQRRKNSSRWTYFCFLLLWVWVKANFLNFIRQTTEVTTLLSIIMFSQIITSLIPESSLSTPKIGNVVVEYVLFLFFYSLTTKLE